VTRKAAEWEEWGWKESWRRRDVSSSRRKVECWKVKDWQEKRETECALAIKEK